MIFSKERNDCLKFIQKQLNHIPAVISGPFNKHSEIYRAILGHSQKEDTFITLNYDLIFDYSINGFRNDKNSFFGDMFKDRLAHIIARPVFEVGGLDEITPVGEWEGFFLKLHGSLGWSFCPQESCINHQQFYPDPPFGGRKEVGSDAPCRICGSVLIPVIIPPALGKSFEKYPKMGILWNIAYREIQKADKLIFIGMSLPESDYYLRWLLREAITSTKKARDIVVVNPCDNDAEKIRTLLGTSPFQNGKNRFRSLKEFADSLAV